MKFTLIVDIPDEDIIAHVEDLKAEAWDVDEALIINKIGNVCYLGLDCTLAMIARKFDGLTGDAYVEKLNNEH